MQCCRLLLIAILLTVLSPLAASAQSFGPWHIPSTCAQFFGCRYGPGHHAPMVRVPGYHPAHSQRFVYQSAPCQYCDGHQCASPVASQHWAPQPNGQYPRQAPPMNQSVPTYVEPLLQPNTPPELIQPQSPTGQFHPASPNRPVQWQQAQWQQAQRHF